MALRFGVALLLALTIGLIAYWRGTLSPSGVLGAVLTGTAFFGFGGWTGAALLLGFFVSSSVLSRFQGQQKSTVNADFSKGHRRDIWQALANGGVAALAATAAYFLNQPWLWVAAIGALAAANADTWATEIGVLSKNWPRKITTLKSVPPGTSGGISWAGTGAALLGAGFIGGIGAIAAFFGFAGLTPIMLFIAATLAGLGGSLFDSLLGATVQRIYYCDTCQKDTERHPHHRCGSPTHPIRGLAIINNDVVNFGATLCGALLAVGLYGLFV